jgi:hypothetical protein
MVGAAGFLLAPGFGVALGLTDVVVLTGAAATVPIMLRAIAAADKDRNLRFNYDPHSKKQRCSYRTTFLSI